MKCPLKLSPEIAKFIKSNDLVYVGVGNSDDVFVKDGKIICKSLRVTPEGLAGNGCKMTDHFGGLGDNHYFIRRADAKTHFPHCLPKPRPKTPKLRYFIPVGICESLFAYGTHDGGTGQGNAYHFDGKKNFALGYIKGVECHVQCGNWREVPQSEALARVKPPKTEAETLREENAALKARVAALEAEKGKLREAIRVLKNFGA